MSNYRLALAGLYFAGHLTCFTQDAGIIKLIESIQQHLHNTEVGRKKFKVKINANKSNAIVFTRSKKVPNEIEIENSQIPWSKKVRYLGNTLDARLTFKSHI